VNLGGFLRTFDPSNPSELAFSMHEKWVAVHPVVLAFTASVADCVSAKGGEHTGEVTNVGSLPYLIRMGLFEHLKLPPGKRITAHEAAGRFIPLQRISSTDDLTRFIVDMIPLLHASPTEVEPVRYVISELVRNVFEHASSARGAFIAAQYFKRSNTLGIGVCDSGIGIRESLSRHHTVPTHSDAVYKALVPGISGTTSRLGGTAYNAGAGLFFTKSIAAASRNYFTVYTGDALFKLRPTPPKQPILLFADAERDRHTMETGLPNWNGTLVGIDISLSKGTTFAALMDLIRKVFGKSIRKEKQKPMIRPRFT